MKAAEPAVSINAIEAGYRMVVGDNTIAVRLSSSYSASVVARVYYSQASGLHLTAAKSAAY